MKRGVDFTQDPATGYVHVPVLDNTPEEPCHGCDLKYGSPPCISAHCIAGDRPDHNEVIWKALISDKLASHILDGEIK